MAYARFVTTKVANAFPVSYKEKDRAESKAERKKASTIEMEFRAGKTYQERQLGHRMNCKSSIYITRKHLRRTHTLTPRPEISRFS
jgi:hypothetical protein